MYLKFISKRPNPHDVKQFVAAQLSIGSSYSLDGHLCFEIWADEFHCLPPFLLPCFDWRLSSCVPDNLETWGTER